MKKKNFVKLIAMYCAFFILISPFSMSVRADDSPDVLSKIDISLIQKMDEGLKGDKHQTVIWLKDINHDEVKRQIDLVEITTTTIQEDLDNSEMQANISCENNIQTADEFQTEIEIKRKVYSGIYEKHNRMIFNNLLSAKNSIPEEEFSNTNSVWYSQYAPIIKSNLTAEQILEFAKSELVDYVYDGAVLISSGDGKIANENYAEQGRETVSRSSPSSVWQRATNADINRDTYGYDGTGVKVGLIDTGVIRWSELDSTERSVFSSIYNAGRLISDPNVPTGTDNDHAAWCGSIIVSGISSCEGLAPNVTLYSSTGANRVGGSEGAFEWLISQGVNVISCSMHWSSPTLAGQYDYMARYIDHIYVHHDATIVLSGGNEESHNTLVTPSSAMSYNAIVVGNVDDKTTSSRSDDTYAQNSCYSTNSLLAAKPDVAAPGHYIQSPFGAFQGSSFSAPQVAAIVAQLFTQRPALKTGQTLSKAIIMASIGSYGGSNQPKSTAGTNSPALHPRLGAGEVDAAGVRFIAKNYRYVNTTFTSSSSVYTKTFTVSSSDTLMNVALVWQKNNRMTGSHTSYNDPSNPACAQLTLEVTAPNGTKFTSARTYGNVQMLTFVPVGTGTYTIKVTKVSAPASEPTVTFALAWR